MKLVILYTNQHVIALDETYGFLAYKIKEKKKEINLRIIY